MDPVSTMKALILSILGPYEPTTTETGQFVGGLASLDYVWLAGAVCFCIMLVGVLCILRTMIKGLFD